MTQISCDCGEFEAELTGFPKNSPGRLACYCRDCQSYLERLGREELLDPYGGTEVIPVYPDEFRVLKGEQHLRCNVLKLKGLNRWSTQCCNSPIANIKPQFPLLGILHNAYKAKDPQALEGLGAIRSRIFGRDAKGTPPFKLSRELGPKDILVVLPFLLKGLFRKKHKKSVFFKDDGVTPVSSPVVLHEVEGS